MNSGQFQKKEFCKRGHKLAETRYVHPTNKKYTYCRLCQKLAYSSYHAKTRDKYKHLKRSYNITRNDYEALLIDQNGTCAICKNSPTPNWSLCVDHNHATGTVRGLLCHRCNAGLGLFKDNPELMLHAIEYIKRSSIRS